MGDPGVRHSRPDRMTTGNAWVEVLEYPGKRFDTLFAIAAGFLCTCAGAIYMKRGKYAAAIRAEGGSPLHYGFPLLLLALKNLLLIGLSGVFLVNIFDAKDEQSFLFPQRYWTDFVAIGIASFEFQMWVWPMIAKESRVV